MFRFLSSFGSTGALYENLKAKKVFEDIKDKISFNNTTYHRYQLEKLGSCGVFKKNLLERILAIKNVQERQRVLETALNPKSPLGVIFATPRFFGIPTVKKGIMKQLHDAYVELLNGRSLHDLKTIKSIS